LTPKGKEQCRALSSAFQYHNEVDIIFASPLRRTIQTAALSFGPALSRKDVPFVLHPALQEVGDMESDKGIANSKEDLKRLLPELFAKDQLDFDIEKIDASGVMEGWNSKASIAPKGEHAKAPNANSNSVRLTARLLGL
jgi:broad specificity phosphatase PhoE